MRAKRPSLLVFAVVILAGIIFTVVAYAVWNSVELTVIRMNVKIDNVIGFNIGNATLDFGRIPPSATAERKVNVMNNAPVTRRVTLYAVGELNEWGDVSANNFFLSQGKNKTVTVSVTAPANAQNGTVHEGFLLVIMRKA